MWKLEECSLGTVFQVEGTVMAKAWGQMLACVRSSTKSLVDRVRGQWRIGRETSVRKPGKDMDICSACTGTPW